ncbi:MAG: multicopper oxidase family protein [Gemmatimonadales bacterium]|nr:multicopper oxidase family protein [Gemmatimonadales bacterium]
MLLTLLQAPPARPAASGPPPLTCADSSVTTLGDLSLHCVDLVPVPDVTTMSGYAELDYAPTPYGIPVTREGVVRWQVRMRLSGLRHRPSPRWIGGPHYVAWVAPPSMAPLIRLGRVRNGANLVGEVALPVFTLFVTEEADTAPATMGKLLLRAQSPSALMQPHGSSRLPAREAGAHQHGAWPMPPMHPRVTSMPPGLEVLQPDATPWWPSATPVPTAPPAAAARGAARARARPARGAPANAPPAPPDAEAIVLGAKDTAVLVTAPLARTLAGRAFTGYAWNGRVPAPTLRATEGLRSTLRVVNALGEPTTVHWHGLRHDWRQDGAVGLSQEPIAPGATFTYRLAFPDPGLFWYHPHLREDRQMDLGLAGTIRVAARRDDWLAPVDAEHVLLLDDILLGDSTVYPHGAERPTHALMGRFGNVITVNGAVRPELALRAGQVVRLWFANAAGVRPFNLAFEEPLPMKLVAADMGRMEQERRVDVVTIAPAERWAVDVRLDQPGRYALVNRVLGVDPVQQAYFPQVDTVATLVVSAADTPAAPTPAQRGFDALARHDEETDRFDAWRDAAPQRELLLTLQPTGLPIGLEQAMRADTQYVQPVEWVGTMPMMDVLSTPRQARWILRDVASGKENHEIAWRVPRDGVQKVRIRNDRHTLHAMQHPIHLHGQRFVVLAVNGRPAADRAWKDTVLVPAGATVDVLVWFQNPGRWMLHCHVPEHLASGMHAVITVGDEEGR